METREAQLDDSDGFDGTDDGDLPSPAWEDRLSELADYRKNTGTATFLQLQ
jgi:hypothetical protein